MQGMEIARRLGEADYFTIELVNTTGSKQGKEEMLILCDDGEMWTYREINDYQAPLIEFDHWQIDLHLHPEAYKDRLAGEVNREVFEREVDWYVNGDSRYHEL